MPTKTTYDSRLLSIRRQPGVFYRDFNLWVPKTVDEQEIRRLKTLNRFIIVDVKSPRGFHTRDLFVETDHHLIIPRHSRVKAAPAKVVDVRPRVEYVRFHPDLITLDYQGTTHQQKSLDALESAGHGILNLACGKGKTVVALKLIARRHQPAVVIVHTRDLLEQWKAAIHKFLPSATIGEIFAGKDDWKHADITIASIATLISKNYTATPEFRTRFGTIIWDEVHHLAADKFSLTADMFLGARFGLSATDKRQDGLEYLYYYNIGPVVYSDLSQQLKPRVAFHLMPTAPDLESPQARRAITDTRGEVHLSRLIRWVCTDEQRLNKEINLYSWLVKSGRKTLVLSHSVDHLKELYTRLHQQLEVGICIGEILDMEVRRFHLQNPPLVLATTRLATEALDRKDFDTLVLANPIGSGIAAQNAFQQAAGRILRPMEGKQPVVLILQDIHVGKLFGMTRAMHRMISRWPAHRGGPFEIYSTETFEDISKLWQPDSCKINS